jgi:oligopeptide/dipeptide ABC transporter ATP-binding protein
MDEPTAALDLLMQRSITKMLAELRDKYNLTILFITHDLPLVSSLTDRLIVMYAFNFIETGDRNDVLLGAAHPYTRALLNAVPSVDANVDEMAPIEGRSPDPVDVPEGCAYHPRCALATDRCRNEDPESQSIEGEAGHTVSCFHWERAREELGYSLSEDGERL